MRKGLEPALRAGIAAVLLPPPYLPIGEDRGRGFELFKECRAKKEPSRFWEGFAVRTGLEPATPGVTGPYSNQLNYRTKILKGLF